VYQNIGVNIDITPRTHHDDEVTLTLKLSVNRDVGTGFGGLPAFANREINTTIRLRDGETNMLAGLIRDDERTVLAGLPGLSDLPLIGRLFARNTKDTQQTDIVLTLTLHIVRILDPLKRIQPFKMSRDTGALGLGGDAPPIQFNSARRGAGAADDARAIRPARPWRCFALFRNRSQPLGKLPCPSRCRRQRSRAAAAGRKVW
jgi:general secretion pathway protein D